MPTKEIWVLVADSGRARLFSIRRDRDRELYELKTFVQPKQTRSEGKSVRDRPGRVFESASETRSALEPATSSKEKSSENFAQEISRSLHKAASQEAFQQLIVVATPEFLGRLRKHFSQLTTKMVKLEIQKDLSKLSVQALSAQLSEPVFGPAANSMH